MTITLVDPVVSVIVAVTAFRETLFTGGLRQVIEFAAVAAMVVGSWLASTRRRPGGG
jgi:hypothetical protein